MSAPVQHRTSIVTIELPYTPPPVALEPVETNPVRREREEKIVQIVGNLARLREKKILELDERNREIGDRVGRNILFQTPRHRNSFIAALNEIASDIDYQLIRQLLEYITGRKVRVIGKHISQFQAITETYKSDLSSDEYFQKIREMVDRLEIK